MLQHLQDDNSKDVVDQAKLGQLDFGRKASPNARNAPNEPITERTQLPPLRAPFDAAFDVTSDKTQAGKHDWQLPAGWDEDPDQEYDTGVEMIGGGDVDYSDEENAVTDKESHRVEDMIMDSIMSS